MSEKITLANEVMTLRTGFCAVLWVKRRMWVDPPVSPFCWTTHIQNTGKYPLSLE